MSFPVYDIEPGECACILGDPRAGSRRVPASKLSAAGILLDPSSGLKAGQYVYTSVVLDGGPSLALAGVVVSALGKGTFIRWSHSSQAEAARVSGTIEEHFRKKGKAPVDPPRPAVSAEAALPAPRSSRDPVPAPALPGAGAPLAPAAGVDVVAAIRRKARRVRSSDLASRMETVEILDLGTIRGLIQEAVDDSVALLGHRLKEAERAHLLEEAEEGFEERMGVFRAEKKGLEEKTRLLQEQLGKVQGLLDEERARVVSADRFTVSDGGLVELEARLGRILDHSIRNGQAGGGLEDELRSIVARLLDDEREKIRARAQEAQNDRIALLERKVGRLADSLEQAQSERDKAQRRAQALEATGLVPARNLLQAGLGEGDPEKERKLSLLKEIVGFNREIRKDLKAIGRLPSSPLPVEEEISEVVTAT